LDNFVLAVDIGGSKLLTGIADAQGHILDKNMRDLSPGITARQLLYAIRDSISVLMARVPHPAAAGISVPGVADAEKGVLRYACFSGITDFAIGPLLQTDLGIPVAVDNDVNACAVGERTFGCCRDVDDFIWITISNGIGGGIYSGGRLVSGHRGCAGEIGHVTVEEQSPALCPCGKSGCLEAQASGRAIARMYAEMTGYSTDARQIAGRAKAGEAAALEVYRRAGSYVGRAAAAFANALNPQKIVLGGGVSMDFELLEDGLAESPKRYAFRENLMDLTLEKTALGYDASLIGAAALAWEKVKI